jgi:hypothetical protein
MTLVPANFPPSKGTQAAGANVLLELLNRKRLSSETEGYRMSPIITSPRPLTKLIARAARPKTQFNPQTHSTKTVAERNPLAELRPEAGSLERWIDMNA